MTVQQTLDERGKRYGDFSDHARIAQCIKASFYAATAWDDLPDTHKQALETIADKIARILNGDPNYADNWHDIQGYARLVEERLAVAPEGSSIWRTWSPHLHGSPSQPPKDVVSVLRRDGVVIEAYKANVWGPIPDDPNIEIVGYKLAGDP